MLWACVGNKDTMLLPISVLGQYTSFIGGALKMQKAPDMHLSAFFLLSLK
jgi:hypothetical protein